MRVKKNPKAFAYRVPIGDYNYLQCRSKDFEAIKAGKLAIWPWLICQYNKNTLMDLPKLVI